MADDLHDPAPTAAQPPRIEQTLEVAAFLFLIVPGLALSYFVKGPASLRFELLAVSTVLRDLSLVALLLFFLWRNREPFSWIGLTHRNLLGEALLGVLLYVPFAFITGWLERVFERSGLSAPGPSSPFAFRGTGDLALAIFMVVVVAIAEEAIFRGYLLRRFIAITGSATFSVVLSTVIFALGHGYEGTASVLTVGVMGLFLAVLYLWRRSLVAPIVLHFLQDFIAIVLVPLAHTR